MCARWFAAVSAFACASLAALQGASAQIVDADAFFEAFRERSAAATTLSLATTSACYPDRFAPADVARCADALRAEGQAIQDLVTELSRFAPPPGLERPLRDYLDLLGREGAATAALADAVGRDEAEARRLASEANSASLAANAPEAVIRAAAPTPGLVDSLTDDGFDWLLLLPLGAGLLSIVAGIFGLAATRSRPSVAVYRSEDQSTAPDKRPEPPQPSTALELAATAASDFSRLVAALEASSKQAPSAYRVAFVSGLFALAAAAIAKVP